jgi:hypothetical protein
MSKKPGAPLSRGHFGEALVDDTQVLIRANIKKLFTIESGSINSYI